VKARVDTAVEAAKLRKEGAVVEIRVAATIEAN